MILKQPRSLIYQIFDSKVLEMLEPRYSTSVPFKADTLEALVKQLQVDHKQAMKSLDDYNAAAGRGGKFDPRSSTICIPKASSRPKRTGHRNSTSLRMSPTRLRAASHLRSAV